MDSLIRLLRDGAVEGVKPLALVLDTVQVVGGAALVQQAVKRVAASGAAGVLVVAMEHPPQVYHRACRGVPAGQLATLDCHSNAYGWHAGQSLQVAGVAAFCSGGLIALEEAVLAHLAAPSPPQWCLVMDGISELAHVFGCSEVAALLARLQRAAGVASLLCGVHADLHTPQELALLQQGAACVVQLQPTSTLLEEGQGAGARRWLMHARFKRHSGRVRVEAKAYRISSDGVHFSDATLAPTDAVAPDAGAGTPAAEAVPPAGQMRLQLTEAERHAREGVRLPYEHQGQGALYTTGDFRDYLPAEAGGREAAQGGRLGHILYIRDSDSEDPDSDEDPDDDLDI